MINAFAAWACIFFRILVICIFIHDSKSPITPDFLRTFGFRV